MFEIAIILSIISAIGFGVADMWSAVPARRLPARQIVFYELLMLFCIYWIITLLITKDVPVLDLKQLAVTAFTGIGLALAVAALYKSLALGKVGIVSPIFNSDSLIAVVLGFIVFGETLDTLDYVSMAIVLAGIFLLSANLRAWRNLSSHEPGVTWALLSMFSFGAALAGYKYLSADLTPFQVITVVNAAALIVLVFTTRNIQSYFNLKQAGYNNLLHIFGISVTILVAMFSLVSALSIDSLSVVAVITGSSPLVSVLLAWLLFKERLTLVQYLGAITVVIGIMILSSH